MSHNPIPKIKKCLFFLYYGMMLGDGMGNKVLLVYFLFRGKVIEHINASLRDLLPPPSRVEIVFNDKKLSLHVSKDCSVPHVFYEVFVNQDYKVDLDVVPRYIFDIGAHYGFTTLFYHCLYPEAMIYSFEPNSENFEYLRLNTSHNRNISIFRIAIFSTSSQIPLYLHSANVEHSLLRMSPSAETIQSTTMDDFMVAQGISHIDLVKIDAEGAEEEILTKTRSLGQINHIIGELHLNLINPQNIIAALTRADFKIHLKSPEPHLAFISACRS